MDVDRWNGLAKPCGIVSIKKGYAVPVCFLCFNDKDHGFLTMASADLFGCFSVFG